VHVGFDDAATLGALAVVGVDGARDVTVACEQE